MSPAIPNGSLVLVTGVNGYIASHITNELLRRNYRVRGTVRSAKKGDWIKELFHSQYGKDSFEVTVVEDMAAENAFDKAMEGCAGVAHVASNLTFDSNPNAVIPEVLAGMKNTLRAAAKHASVKRFVYTSSSTAATAPKPNKRFHVDADTWNEEQVEQAWAPPPYNADRSWAVYGASKTQAERECWRFVREEKPSFVLSTVLPNCNIGRIMSKEQPASTAGWFKKLWEGDEGTKQMLMKEIPPQYYINVRDTALLHVAALVEEDVRGERLFAFAGPFNYDMVAEAMNKMGVPNELELVGGMAEDLSTVDTKRPEELLKRYGRSGFTGLEESLRENVAAI